MPGFEMLYGGYWMSVTADDLSIDIYSDGSRCSLCFSGYDTIDYWILGDAFMRGWYNIHDHTNKRMGFVGLASGGKEVPVEATEIPTTPLPNVDISTDFTLFGMDAVTFITIVVLAFILTACTVGITIIFCTSFASFVMGKGFRLQKTPCDQQISFSNKKKNKSKTESDESQISLIYLQ